MNAIRRFGVAGSSLLLLVLALSAPSAAGARGTAHCVSAGPLPQTPLPVGDAPLHIGIGLFLVDVSHISDPDQSFAADFALGVQWRDPRLARAVTGDDELCYFNLDEIWYPGITFLNRRAFTTDFTDVIEVDAEGNALYRQRFQGTFTALGELSEFPFDERALRIGMVNLDRAAQDVVLEALPHRSGRSEHFSIPNWKIGPYEVESSVFEAANGRQLARLDFVFRAERRPRYYVWNAVVPLMLIVFMSWSVFWIDPSHLEAQLAVSSMSMLTLVTYRFSLGSILPPISYLTRMDVFLTGGTLLVFLALAEAVLTSSIADRGGPERAKRIDRWARLVFPSALILVTAAAFWW